jgi:hypothetical protein
LSAFSISKGGEIVKNKLNCKPANCKLCTEYSSEKGCVSKHCAYLAERIAAQSLNYRGAVTEAFQSIPMFADHVTAIQKRLSNSMWNGAEHKRRMKALRLYTNQRKSIYTNEYLAVMYLLTATKTLYERTHPCFKPQGLDFSLAQKAGLSVDEYTMLGAAKTLYYGTGDLTAEDMIEPEIISSEVLPFIVYAVLIVRFGEKVLNHVW